MPTESLVVSIAVVAAFFLFSVTLAVVSRGSHKR